MTFVSGRASNGALVTLTFHDRGQQREAWADDRRPAGIEVATACRDPARAPCGCPRDGPGRRHRVIATKTLIVTGGKARNFTLKLTRAARHDLLRRRSLRVSAIATTSDRTGHHATTRTSTKLLAPKRR